MSVLKKIKEIRKQKGLNQKEMAEKLNISISSYQKIEQGILVLSLNRFLEICMILEIDSYNLLLPAVNEDIVGQIEKILIGGSLAFDNIRSNSKYSRNLVNDLKDKIEKSGIDKSKIIGDLDHIEDFLALIGKDSFDYEYKFTSIRKLIENID